MNKVAAANEKSIIKDTNDPWAATLGPGRIEALTDGVMAIAMTNLVL